MPPRPRPTPPTKQALPKHLTRSQVQAGMRRIKKWVRRCHDKFKVPGLANVEVKIERDGRISSAKIKGFFVDTPTGACVVSVVRTAIFPRFKSAPITLTYPFVLR